jgi:hypothetical protein
VNPTIELKFQYLESDYLRAVRAADPSAHHWKLDIILTLVLVGIGLYAWHSEGPRWPAVVCLVVPIGYALMLFAILKVIPSHIFRHEEKFFDEYSLTFSPQGIHFKTARIDSQLQWRLYSRALIDPYSYILFSGARQFTVIPKRAFESALQQQAFEQLLEEQIPEIIRRGG